MKVRNYIMFEELKRHITVLV